MTHLKVSLPIDLQEYVAIVVGDDGRRSTPNFTAKHRFMTSMIETIRRTMAGFEMAGVSCAGLHFTLPVEVYVLTRCTIGAENAALSVLEVIAQNSGILPDKIGPEYPTPERTKVAFDQVGDLLWAAQQRVVAMESKMVANIARAAIDERHRIAAEIRDIGPDFDVDDYVETLERTP